MVPPRVRARPTGSSAANLLHRVDRLAYDDAMDVRLSMTSDRQDAKSDVPRLLLGTGGNHRERKDVCQVLPGAPLELGVEPGDLIVPSDAEVGGWIATNRELVTGGAEFDQSQVAIAVSVYEERNGLTLGPDDRLKLASGCRARSLHGVTRCHVPSDS